MYYDHEGHAIATSTADAASQLSAHEQAQFFGYDCYDACCSDERAAEQEADLMGSLQDVAPQTEADDPWFIPKDAKRAWTPRTRELMAASDPWEQAPSWTPELSQSSLSPGSAEALDPPF